MKDLYDAIAAAELEKLKAVRQIFDSHFAALDAEVGELVANIHPSTAARGFLLRAHSNIRGLGSELGRIIEQYEQKNSA